MKIKCCSPRLALTLALAGLTFAQLGCNLRRGMSLSDTTRHLSLSPDRKLFLYDSVHEKEAIVSLYDLSTRASKRLTFKSDYAYAPMWVDRERVIFTKVDRVH